MYRLKFCFEWVESFDWFFGEKVNNYILVICVIESCIFFKFYKMDSWEFVKVVKNEVVEKYSLILILLIY